ncbi:MAG: hypothetical protein AB1508_06775 [Pseudomonadota bacterium]
MQNWQRSDYLALAAIVVSVLAMVGTFWQAYVNYLQRRENRSVWQPMLEVRFLPLRNWPGWFKIKVTISNRGPQMLECESISILWPSQMGVLRYRDVVGADRSGNDAFPLQPPEAKLPKSAKIDTCIQPVGSEANGLFGKVYRSDTRSVELLTFIGETSGNARTRLRNSSQRCRIMLRLSRNASDIFQRQITTEVMLPTDTTKTQV